MKRISYLLLLVLLTTIIISSCSNQRTYARQLDDEKTLIAAFISRYNINVMNSFPKDSVWKDNDYVLLTSGLYFHMVNYGDVSSTDSLEFKDKVVARYKQYTLDVVSDTISNWSTIDFPSPPVFVYGDYSQSCIGFQEAVSYMKRNDSEAKFIIPSKLGFSNYMTSVTPLGYDMKIKIQK